MDVDNNESEEDVLQRKTSPTKPTLRPLLITSAKNNADGRLRTRGSITRYSSGILSVPQSLSPNYKAGQTSITQRALSVERRRPPPTPLSPPSRRSSAPSSPTFSSSFRRSAPWSPTSRSPPPTSPVSKSSRPLSSSSSSSSRRTFTPFSSPSSRPSTSVRDTMVEKLTASRRSLVGRAPPDGLWPSIRSNVSSSSSSSFLSDSSSSVVGSRGERLIRNPLPDLSERKKMHVRAWSGSEQTENSRPVENSHFRAMDQLRWPGMVGGKVSTSRSMDLTDRSASLPISVRGFSPTRRMTFTFTDVVSQAVQNSANEDAQSVSSSGSGNDAQSVSSSGTVDVTSLPSVTRHKRSPALLPIHIRPSSPTKALQTFSSRGMLSPSRTIPSTPFSPPSDTSIQSGGSFSSSIMNYIGGVRKGSASPTYTRDALQLRLVYNRALQWRFVNARSEAALSTQKAVAEDMLYSVWNITSKLRDSVVVKRTDVQNLRQEMGLMPKLKKQMPYLEDWSALEAEHSNSLSGLIQALQAILWRLPVKGGARADIRAVKSAIISIVDVMQAMGSSICSMLSGVQGANSLASELCEVAMAESVMLDECQELLASTASMQVYECSLRTHLIQLRQSLPVE